MNNWIRDQIDYAEKPSSKQIRETFMKAKKNITNIMEMFDVVDSLFNKFEDKLK